MTDSIDRLYDAVLEAMDADPSSSRTARLLRAGLGKIAKKVAEEAVEVVIEAMQGHREAVVRESADLLYNLAVLWASADVEPKAIWKEMNRRERLFGIAEKLAKQRGLMKARRKAVPRRAARMRKRG
jgi:phosphoribosyl-ATP pyrophosphohydrolase